MYCNTNLFYHNINKRRIMSRMGHDCFEGAYSFLPEIYLIYLFIRYGRWVTRRVAICTIALIWLLAALISFLPISLGLHRPHEETAATQKPPRHFTCALELTPTYAVVSSCISFYLPCIVMISIYCR